VAVITYKLYLSRRYWG